MIRTRRTLLYALAGFTAAVAVFYYWGIHVAAAASIFAILYILWGKKGGSLRVGALIGSFYIIGTVCFYTVCFSQGEHLLIEAGNIQATGQILQTDIRTKDNGTRLIQIKMRVLEADGRVSSWTGNEAVLINRYIKEPGKWEEERQKYDFVPGNIIKVSGHAETPPDRRNPGCFDYRLYLGAMGIKRTVTASDICVVERTGSDTVRGSMYIIREDFLSRLEEETDRATAAMLGGIMFGQTEAMDENILEEFQKNGTAHILAVSGLHIGMIYGFLGRLWPRKRGGLFFIAATVFFICYGAMASFAPSVVRAVIMIELHMIADMKHKRYDMASAAFLAALLMLIKNPMQLFSPGFQMSFIAVLVLALLIPVVKKFYNGVFLSAIVIQAGLLPYTAYTFNYISIGAVFVNIPMIFLAGLIVPAGLCALFFSGNWEWMFQLMSSFLSVMCNALSEINSITAIEGVTVFSVVSPDVRLVLLYYLCLLFFASEEGRLMIMRKQKKKVLIAVITVIVATALLGAANSNRCRNADVVFVDVGQGDCIHVRGEEDAEYLIDCGGNISFNVGEETLRPYLLKNGVKKLDGIFVTHMHTDHYKGAAELCREGMADRLYLYEGYKEREAEILEDTGLEKKDVVYLYAGQRVVLSQDTYIDVLWPDRKSSGAYKKMMEKDEDENQTCLILKVSSGGISLLVTGDVDGECQRGLEKKYGKRLKCDILKVAHHGSKYSYCHEFLKASKPQYAVFQVGRNNFGHPDQGVIEKYRRKGIIIYRNDKDGAVAFKAGEKGRIGVTVIRRDR